MSKSLFSIFCLLVGLCAMASNQGSDGEGSTNRVDQFGRKQGHWVLKAHMLNVDGYPSEATVEEGQFKDDLRQGIWVRFFPDGKIRSEVFYLANVPTGEYKVYYDNGQLQENGNWKQNKNIGQFSRFYPNGKHQQKFEFSEQGKRNGTQFYYHENGELAMEVAIHNGVENGLMVRYDEKGNKIEERTFENGAVKTGSIKKFGNSPKPEPKVEMPKDAIALNPVAEGKSNNAQTFVENGFNTLYNKDYQITQTGMFKNAKLYDGKWMRYNADGIIVRIDVYKNGRFIGNGQLEEFEK